MSQAKVKVLDAYKRDVGNGTIRIDVHTMDKIGAKLDDIIKVVGNNNATTYCTAIPLSQYDDYKQTCRLDRLERSNANVKQTEYVTISKVNVTPAESMHVIPVDAIPPLDERYLADALDMTPTSKGSTITVPYFGGSLVFQVKETNPEGPVLITKQTVFTILPRIPEEPEPDSLETILINKLNNIENKLDNIMNVLSKKGFAD